MLVPLRGPASSRIDRLHSGYSVSRPRATMSPTHASGFRARTPSFLSGRRATRPILSGLPVYPLRSAMSHCESIPVDQADTAPSVGAVDSSLHGGSGCETHPPRGRGRRPGPQDRQRKRTRGQTANYAGRFTVPPVRVTPGASRWRCGPQELNRQAHRRGHRDPGLSPGRTKTPMRTPATTSDARRQ